MTPRETKFVAGAIMVLGAVLLAVDLVLGRWLVAIHAAGLVVAGWFGWRMGDKLERLNTLLGRP